jgi:hypothetical protein
MQDVSVAKKTVKTGIKNALDITVFTHLLGH